MVAVTPLPRWNGWQWHRASPLGLTAAPPHLFLLAGKSTAVTRAALISQPSPAASGHRFLLDFTGGQRCTSSAATVARSLATITAAPLFRRTRRMQRRSSPLNSMAAAPRCFSSKVNSSAAYLFPHFVDRKIVRYAPVSTAIGACSSYCHHRQSPFLTQPAAIAVGAAALQPHSPVSSFLNS